ncbi:MAG: cytochrome c oxidase subunit II [Acidimicrobiales bacterium]
MSDQSTPNDQPSFRKPASWPLRIFGGIAIIIVTAVFVTQVAAVFRPEGKPLNTLNPQGPNAQTIQTLVTPVFVVAGIIGILVMAAVLYIAWRFRTRPDEDEDEFNAQREGNTALELTWTAIPALILVGIGLGTVITIQDLEKRSPDALKVEVYAQQWWWGFKYDVDNNGSFTDRGDVNTATELVIPTGREIALEETSNDVIHSFWIPELNGKKDAVPGQFNSWKLQADQPGVYLGQCTEFCGLSHGNMRMLVRALSPSDFDAWLANQLQPAREPDPANTLAVEGKSVFTGQLCSSCHLIRGVNDEKVNDPEKGVKSQLVSGVAPELTHFASRGMFAGAIYNAHYPNPAGNNQPLGRTCTENDLSGCGDPADVNLPGNPDNPFNSVAIQAWLRNPPAMKPMYVEQTQYTSKLRGMPNLGLSEQQIQQLTAYLESLR